VKVVAIVEARMTSSRLPGKVLLKTLEVPMLGRLVDRLKQIPLIHEIVIATTTNQDDDEICNLASNYGIQFYRGSEHDVMSRVLEAALEAKADVIVEITGDCPIIDINIVNNAITCYLEGDYDYVSNANIRSYPDGMDVQVFNVKTLLDSWKSTSDPLHREHVTLHIRQNPGKYQLFDILAEEEFHFPELGLTLDTEEDFIFLKKIIQNLEPTNKYFGLPEIMHLLEMSPELKELNAHVIRKGDT
jgi:spore coat polysaccharide biosynthesis protein SpsF